MFRPRRHYSRKRHELRSIATPIDHVLMAYPGFTYTYEQGAVHGTIFHIGTRLEPGPNDVRDFAVVLFFELPTGEVVDVAQVDNTVHEDGVIHVHRNYREVGVAIRDFETRISTWMEAEEYLREHAERMVRTYLDNHGRAPRKSD